MDGELREILCRMIPKNIIFIFVFHFAQSRSVLEKWENTVKSQHSKCLNSVKLDNVGIGEEVLKIVSCGEPWARWNYKYKVKTIDL